MKQCLVVGAVILAAAGIADLVTDAIESHDWDKKPVMDAERYTQHLKGRVEQFEYLQDYRTGICFALYPPHGFTSVDCAMVPAELLQTVTVSASPSEADTE